MLRSHQESEQSRLVHARSSRAHNGPMRNSMYLRQHYMREKNAMAKKNENKLKLVAFRAFFVYKLEFRNARIRLLVKIHT